MLEEKLHDLSSMIGRLALLPAHTALFLLAPGKNVFAIAKLLYILRTAPCCDSTELLGYDEMIRTSLAAILNINLSTSAWAQACLPPRWGGIGVRSAHQLAPSAFLASAAGVTGTVCLLGFCCWCHWTPFPSPPERHHLTARSSSDEIGGSMEISGGRGQPRCGGDEGSASMGRRDLLDVGKQVDGTGDRRHCSRPYMPPMLRAQEHGSMPCPARPLVSIWTTARCGWP